MAPSIPAAWLAPEPLERAHALPAPLYTDAELHRAEQQLVFAKSWQLVAHGDALANPGDHVVAAIGPVPILVVRGAHGELRAFHNVCRHRAGPIATCDGKGAKALTCKYHGWTYTLDGTLRGAPEMDGAQQFDRAAFRLPEARVATFGPLVFAALDDAPPFAEVFAGIEQRIAANRMQQARFHRRFHYEVACNWKVYVDNFLEGYHLPHVHPGLNKLLDYRSYKTELAAWNSLQSSPLVGDDNFYGGGAGSDASRQGAFYWFVYPNTMLNCLPGRLQSNRVVPLGVDRCRVDFDYFYPDGGDAQELARRQQDQDFSDEVQAEDVAICEAVQRGLSSGSYHAGRLCPKREGGVKHFHDLLRAAYRPLAENGRGRPGAAH